MVYKNIFVVDFSHMQNIKQLRDGHYVCGLYMPSCNRGFLFSMNLETCVSVTTVQSVDLKLRIS